MARLGFAPSETERMALEGERAGRHRAGSFVLSREEPGEGERARVYRTRLANALRANAVASTRARATM